MSDWITKKKKESKWITKKPTYITKKPKKKESNWITKKPKKKP